MGNVLCWSHQQAAVLLGTDYLKNFAFYQKSVTKNKCINCSSWSGIRKKSKAYPWAAGNKVLGKGRLCWMTEQFSYQQQNRTYSPTQYCAWAESFKNLVSAWKERSISLWIHPNVENWVESTGSRWSSSGEFSQDSTLQFLATHYAKRFAHGHWSFLGPGSEKNWCGTSNVQAERRMASCRWGHDAQILWKRTRRIPWIQCFGKRKFEKQMKGTIVYTLLWRRQKRCSGSSHDHLRHSAQCPRSSSGHVQWAGQQNLWLFRMYRRTCCSGQSRNYGYSCRIDDNEQIASDRWERARKLAAHLRAKNRKSSIVIFNWQNCVPIQVSWRLWRRDSISRPSTMWT